MGYHRPGHRPPGWDRASWPTEEGRKRYVWMLLCERSAGNPAAHLGQVLSSQLRGCIFRGRKCFHVLPSARQHHLGPAHHARWRDVGQACVRQDGESQQPWAGELVKPSPAAYRAAPRSRSPLGRAAHLVRPTCLSR